MSPRNRLYFKVCRFNCNKRSLYGNFLSDVLPRAAVFVLVVYVWYTMFVISASCNSIREKPFYKFHNRLEMVYWDNVILNDSPGGSTLQWGDLLCLTSLLLFLLCICCTIFVISTSETIRKAPLVEAQTELGKQKIRSVERRYLYNYRILWKTASSHKVSLKSSSRLLSYGQKTIFKMAAVRRLEF